MTLYRFLKGLDWHTVHRQMDWLELVSEQEIEEGRTESDSSHERAESILVLLEKLEDMARDYGINTEGR